MIPLTTIDSRALKKTSFGLNRCQFAPLTAFVVKKCQWPLLDSIELEHSQLEISSFPLMEQLGISFCKKTHKLFQLSSAQSTSTIQEVTNLSKLLFCETHVNVEPIEIIKCILLCVNDRNLSSISAIRPTRIKKSTTVKLNQRPMTGKIPSLPLTHRKVLSTQKRLKGTLSLFQCHRQHDNVNQHTITLNRSHLTLILSSNDQSILLKTFQNDCDLATFNKWIHYTNKWRWYRKNGFN